MSRYIRDQEGTDLGRYLAEGDVASSDPPRTDDQIIDALGRMASAEVTGWAELACIRAYRAYFSHVPASFEAAIDLLVEQDVDKWGECERAASRSLHTCHLRTYGRALNALYARAELADEPSSALRKAADAALTSADRVELRKGG